MPTKFPTTRARQVQLDLVSRLVEQDDFPDPLQTVCGLDVSYYQQTAIGVAVLLTFPELKLLEDEIVYIPTQVPYIPTFLSFREYPALSLAYNSLSQTPDLCFVDAHGKAHPRMLGAASHFGILRDTPTIGVAKSHLCGTLHSNPKSFDTIILNNEIVGARYVSKPGCKPIYISTGHRISLTKAVELTKTCITKYRLPEPIRLAHNIATESRQKLKQT